MEVAVTGPLDESTRLAVVQAAVELWRTKGGQVTLPGVAAIYLSMPEGSRMPHASEGELQGGTAYFVTSVLQDQPKPGSIVRRQATIRMTWPGDSRAERLLRDKLVQMSTRRRNILVLDISADASDISHDGRTRSGDGSNQPSIPEWAQWYSSVRGRPSRGQMFK
jgi:hypothetical protein